MLSAKFIVALFKSMGIDLTPGNKEPSPNDLYEALKKMKNERRP